MATRIPNRTLSFAIAGIPPELDEATVKTIIEAAMAKASAKATKIKPTKVTLRNRNTRAADRFPCTREPAPLHAAAIIWPAGVPHKGCGRTYGSALQRDAHVAGFVDVKRTKPWNTRRFPNGCLDAIVPAHLRDSR